MLLRSAQPQNLSRHVLASKRGRIVGFSLLPRTCVAARHATTQLPALAPGHKIRDVGVKRQLVYHLWVVACGDTKC